MVCLFIFSLFGLCLEPAEDDDGKAPGSESVTKGYQRLPNLEFDYIIASHGSLWEFFIDLIKCINFFSFFITYLKCT